MGQSEKAVYDLFGNPTRKLDRNGDTTVYQYTLLGQLQSVSAEKDGSSANIAYTYDMLGNRKTMTDETGTTTYSYDGLSRITKVADGDGMERAYLYDANDNVTRMGIIAGGAEKFYDHYSYNALNLVKEVIGNGNGHTFEYDKNGNLTKYTYSGKNTTYTYNADNLLASANAVGNTDTYTYYLNGSRKSTSNRKGTTTYIYDGLGRLTQENMSNGENTQYIYDAYGNRIQKSVTGVENPSEISYTYDKNNRLTRETINGDSDEQTINSYYYDNNGDQVYKNTEQYIKPKQLETRLQIKEKGLGASYTYLRNRYYDSDKGRFISEDSIRDGLNWYSYCGDDPINFFDPTGNIREPGHNKKGEWSENPDWDDYGDVPYVYDPLVTLGEIWNNATEAQRKSIEVLAAFVRRMGDDFRTGLRAWAYGGELDKQNISSTEKLVAIANPSGALAVNKAQETAWEEVESRYGVTFGSELDGSNGNAFLHCYWNALITKKIGADWAKLFTDAHEYGIQDNLGLNAQMDLFNNAVGINLGVYNKKQENWYIAGEVQKYVNNGWLLRNKVNGVVQSTNIVTNGDYR